MTNTSSPHKRYEDLRWRVEEKRLERGGNPRLVNPAMRLAREQDAKIKVGCTWRRVMTIVVIGRSGVACAAN